MIVLVPLRPWNDILMKLKSLRIKADVTQEQVVAQLPLKNLSTSRSAYSQMESGSYNIKISELIALSEIFHTDYNTIFVDLSLKDINDIEHN